VSHDVGANFFASLSYPTHGSFFDCAYCPAAGLSTFWPSTSAPAATRLSAAFFSLAGSNQDFVQTSLTFAPGCVACAPSAKAFACRMTSGIGNGTM
jgi:hypothetical protein